MATKAAQLTALGVPSEVAAFIGKDTRLSAVGKTVSTGLTATGTVLSDSYQMTSLINVFSTVALSTGARLPQSVDIGVSVIIQNNGANPLNLFPPTSSGTINGGSAGAAVTIAAAAGNVATRLTSTDWLVSVYAKES